MARVTKNGNLFNSPGQTKTKKNNEKQYAKKKNSIKTQIENVSNIEPK
jgi:hypothetical protein